VNLYATLAAVPSLSNPGISLIYPVQTKSEVKSKDFKPTNRKWRKMIIEDLNRLRQTIAELGLEEKVVLDKIEKAARVVMIDRGWEAPYRLLGPRRNYPRGCER